MLYGALHDRAHTSASTRHSSSAALRPATPPPTTITLSLRTAATHAQYPRPCVFKLCIASRALGHEGAGAEGAGAEGGASFLVHPSHKPDPPLVDNRRLTVVGWASAGAGAAMALALSGGSRRRPPPHPVRSPHHPRHHPSPHPPSVTRRSQTSSSPSHPTRMTHSSKKVCSVTHGMQSASCRRRHVDL
jgi:hypothetical protein